MESVNDFESSTQHISAYIKFCLFFRIHRMYYSIIVGGIALILEVLLFYLILYRSPAQFKVFKKLIFLNNLIAFLFNILCVVLQPMAETKEGHIFLMFEGFFGKVKQPYNCALWMMFQSVMLATILVLPLQYIYRYFLIVRKVNLSTTQFLLISSFGIAIILTLSVSGQIIFSYNQLESVQHDFGLLLKVDPFYAIDIPVFTVLDKKNSFVFVRSLTLSSIIMGSYIIVIVCSYRIFVELRLCTKDMSKSTKEMNSQLNFLLFVQAAVPFVSLGFPVCLPGLLSLFGLSVPNSSVMLVLIIEWAPIVDALATILIVPSYRNALMFWKPQRSLVQGNTVMPQTKNNGLTTIPLFKKSSI